MCPMRRIVPLAAVLALGVFAGCDTFDTPLLEPPTERSLIQDGRDTDFAGSGVFVLPPINNNEYERSAPFDLGANPRLEICELGLPDGEAPTVASVEAAVCESVVAWFETGAAHDEASFISVTPEPGQTAADSMFSVGWNTDAADAGKAFRASILLPDFSFDGTTVEVAYEAAAAFDVVLYDNASTKLDPDRIVGFTAGQNFPIKFIVEEGSRCSGLDCFAYEVTCIADVYRTDHAGVYMPEDWATECTADPGPEFSWWLFQERLPEGSVCVPYDSVSGIPFEPCYVWQLYEEVPTASGIAFEPYNEAFADSATVQFCNDEIPEALQPLASVWRYSTLPSGGTEVVRLEGAQDSAFSGAVCPWVAPSETGSVTLAAFSSFTSGVVRPVLQLLGLEPAPAYAGDQGTLSTKTIRMSDFQRFVETEWQTAIAAPDAAVLGGSFEIGVRLVSPPHHEDGPYAGVPGELVQFEVVGGSTGTATLEADGATPCPGVTDGSCILVPTSLFGATSTTDDAGYATVTATLDGGAGPVTIEVSLPADPGMDVLSFTTEAVDLALAFLEPLETGDFAGAPDELFTPTILICAEALKPCDATSAETVIATPDIKLVEENGRKFYQADWKPRDTNTAQGGTYVAQVQAEGVTVGYSIPIEVTKGGKSERIGDVYYNGVNSSVPLKFTITRVDVP